jgi:hypothetical protein
MLVKNLIRGLNRVIVGLLVLIISLYLLLWALNWQDEAPSPESLQLQQVLAAQQAVPAQDNGYLYYQQHHTKALALPDGLRALLRALSRCAPEQCLTELKTAQAALPQWLAQQQPALNAYHTLLNYPAWQYPLPQLSAELPAMSPLIDMQQLFLMDIWLKVQKGDLAAAQAMLQQDLNFWRQQLISANSLLVKLIAVSQVKRHFDFAANFRQSLDETQYLQLMPAVWRQPFRADELSPMLAMAGEWHFGLSVVESVQQSRPTDQNILERWLTLDLWRPFLKAQATSNTLAMSSLACAEQRSVQAIKISQWYRWVYNPIGKILTQTGIDTCLQHLKPLTELEKARLQLAAVYPPKT